MNTQTQRRNLLKPSIMKTQTHRLQTVRRPGASAGQPQPSPSRAAPVTSRFLSGLALVLFACLALWPGRTAAAAGAFSDTFEGYAEGSNLHGQGGWKGWADNPTAGALVSSNFAFSPPNSVNITGASDLVHTFSSVTNGLWVFSTRQYIPAASTGTNYVILLNK